MKKFAIAALLLALTGCATIERNLASYVISRYVGVWQKDGATQDEMFQSSAVCVLQQNVARPGEPLDEKVYRNCMEAQGWVLRPVPLD